MVIAAVRAPLFVPAGRPKRFARAAATGVVRLACGSIDYCAVGRGNRLGGARAGQRRRAVAVDGAMVDEPVRQRARAILRAAGQAG